MKLSRAADEISSQERSSFLLSVYCQRYYCVQSVLRVFAGAAVLPMLSVLPVLPMLSVLLMLWVQLAVMLINIATSSNVTAFPRRHPHVSCCFIRACKLPHCGPFREVSVWDAKLTRIVMGKSSRELPAGSLEATLWQTCASNPTSACCNYCNALHRLQSIIVIREMVSHYNSFPLLMKFRYIHLLTFKPYLWKIVTGITMYAITEQWQQ